MQTLRDIAPYVALGAAALAAAVLVVVFLLWRSVRRLRRSQTVVLGHHEERDVVAHVADLDTQVRNLREAVEILTDQLDDQKRHLDHALTNRAIIRYDAFRDAGGEQSASFALLDSQRSGVVFSAIAARDFARIYVKHLDHGEADRDLSPEEVRAVEAAVPEPLRRVEAGPRSLRAPRLADAGRPPEGAASPPAPLADSDEAARAFEALADLEAPGGGAARAPVGPEVPDEGAAQPPADDGDFSWDEGPGRPTDAPRD